MPWFQVSQIPDGDVWLRSESILGIAAREGSAVGSRLLLISGSSVEVSDDGDELLQKIKELEGTAGRDRRVGFPAD
jgi:hypothetical protein